MFVGKQHMFHVGNNIANLQTKYYDSVVDFVSDVRLFLFRQDLFGWLRRFL